MNDGDWDEWARFVKIELAKGNAVQGLVSTWRGLKEGMKKYFPEADVWYTERNGDPIVCLVPDGTPPEELPDSALDYIALEWIDPDKSFGTGFCPLANR